MSRMSQKTEPNKTTAFILFKRTENVTDIIIYFFYVVKQNRVVIESKRVYTKTVPCEKTTVTSCQKRLDNKIPRISEPAARVARVEN